MNKLLYVSPELVFDEKVVIIGSSGNLKGSNFGAEIDSYDEVIRFNRAPIKGHECDVGSKTTLRVVNNHVFDNIDIRNRGFTNQPSNFIRDLRNSKILYIGPDLGPWNRREKNTDISNKLFLFHYQNMKKIMKETKFVSPKNLSVGAATVSLCILSGLKPRLVGFDIAGGPRTHYWEERPPAGKCHSPTDEHRWLSVLAKQNKILLGLNENLH